MEQSLADSAGEDACENMNSQRKQALSRKLTRETMICPGGCGKTLQIASVLYSHKCKRRRSEAPPEEIERRLTSLRVRAEGRFQAREEPPSSTVREESPSSTVA
jgi:hypothetical protein